MLQVAGVLGSVAGVVLIAHPPMLFGGHADWGKGRAAAMGALVGAALMAATAITIIRKLASVENSIVMAMWCAAVVHATLCAPISLPTSLHREADSVHLRHTAMPANLLLFFTCTRGESAEGWEGV